MKGLILKDLYQVAKYLRSYLLIIAIFLAASCVTSNQMFFVFYPCMICGMIPVNLLSYDERSKWDVYSCTLPCTKAQIVSAKYLIGLIAQILVLAITAVIQAAHMHTAGNFAWNDFCVLMGMLLIISCVSSSIPLPFMFKFGVEKGRIGYYVMIGVVCGGSFFASSFLNRHLEDTVSLDISLPLLCLTAIGVYALSWYLSIRAYEKREIK